MIEIKVLVIISIISSVLALGKAAFHAFKEEECGEK